jgi:hypothetical protein
MNWIARIGALMAAMVLAASPVFAQSKPMDVADLAVGEYGGDISGVGLFVRVKIEKTGPDEVRVSSIDPRFTPFAGKVTRTGSLLQSTAGGRTFQLDTVKRPAPLRLTGGGEDFSGVRFVNDLADLAEGVYAGDVISDARGSSRSDVKLHVTKIGPNTIRVESDYARLPTFTGRVERVLDTLQLASGPQTFLLDLTRTPYRLDLNEDDASWAGDKVQSGYAPRLD